MKVVRLDQVSPAEAVKQAVGVLQAGGLIIFPTETTYGAGVDATNPEAVARLLEYKARREGKPLSIAVTDSGMAAKYVEINQQASLLYQQFLPGPVTVISKGLHAVAPGVESEFGTLGVRIPDYPLVLEIVQALGRPVTATSANPSDGARPYAIFKLLPTLSGRQTSLVDLVLDAGELPHNPPSTVIDTTLSAPVTMRQGEIHLSSQQITQQSTDPNYRRLSIAEYSADSNWLTSIDQYRSSSIDQLTPINHHPVAAHRHPQPVPTNHQPAVIDRSTLLQTITLDSSTPEETMGIAGRLTLKHWNDVRRTGLVIGLNGPLGAGKTVFAQGVAAFLGIPDHLVSPTHTYIEEYAYTRHQTSGTLYHLDMWKVDTKEVFDRLDFDALLQPKSIVVIEWWEQVASYVDADIPILEISVLDSP